MKAAEGKVDVVPEYEAERTEEGGQEGVEKVWRAETGIVDWDRKLRKEPTADSRGRQVGDD